MRKTNVIAVVSFLVGGITTNGLIFLISDWELSQVSISLFGTLATLVIAITAIFEVFRQNKLHQQEVIREKKKTLRENKEAASAIALTLMLRLADQLGTINVFIKALEFTLPDPPRDDLLQPDRMAWAKYLELFDELTFRDQQDFLQEEKLLRAKKIALIGEDSSVRDTIELSLSSLDLYSENFGSYGTQKTIHNVLSKIGREFTENNYKEHKEFLSDISNQVSNCREEITRKVDELKRKT